MGLVGAGLSGTFANLFILSYNIYHTNSDEGIKEATQVSIKDPEVRENFQTYLKLGLPSLLANSIVQGSFVYISVLCGQLGVHQ